MPGPAGRKALPEKLKLVKGTARKSRTKNAAQPAEGPVVPPTWMLPESQHHFDAIKAELAAVGLDSRTFSFIAGLAADRMLEIERCNADITAHGEVERSDESISRKNPSVGIRSEARRHLQSLLSELGLTGSACARLGSRVKPPEPTGFGRL